MMLPTYYTVAEVAQSLGVSERWVRAQTKAQHDKDGGLIRPAKVNPIRIGQGRQARIKFTPGDVEQLVTSLRPPEPVQRLRRRARRSA